MDKTMENPHETRQNAILARIVANLGRLNTSLETMNDRLEILNKENNDNANVGQLWSSYKQSVQFHLDSTKLPTRPQ
ncbi:DASH complex subunit Dad4 [Chlamydoabsidia padenii]|nr:DASH complex subunit Dad4 [Chlamydoabsidia padenii]